MRFGRNAARYEGMSLSLPQARDSDITVQYTKLIIMLMPKPVAAPLRLERRAKGMPTSVIKKLARGKEILLNRSTVMLES